MAQVQQPTYPFDIPSISVLNIGIPPHLVQTFHLDNDIAAGDLVDIVNAKQAEAVANSLVHLQGKSKASCIIAHIIIHNKHKSLPLRMTS